jgi:hypothetical protein
MCQQKAAQDRHTRQLDHAAQEKHTRQLDRAVPALRPHLNANIHKVHNVQPSLIHGRLQQQAQQRQQQHSLRHTATSTSAASAPLEKGIGLNSITSSGCSHSH